MAWSVSIPVSGGVVFDKIFVLVIPMHAGRCSFFPPPPPPPPPPFSLESYAVLWYCVYLWIIIWAYKIWSLIYNKLAVCECVWSTPVLCRKLGACYCYSLLLATAYYVRFRGTAFTCVSCGRRAFATGASVVTFP